MTPRRPNETEQEILEAFAGISPDNRIVKGVVLLLEMIERREHLDAVAPILPPGVNRDYQAGRDAALIYFRERLEKLIALANPEPQRA